MKPKLNKVDPDKLAHKQLLYAANKLKGAWSFGQLKTFKDLYVHYGVDTKPYFESELNKPLTFQDVKDFLSDREIELSTSIWLRNNPPVIESDVVLECIGNSQAKDTLSSVVKDLGLQPTQDKLNYDIPLLKNEKAFLFWFQKKACKEGLAHVNELKHRAAYLVAAAGVGKTFIYFAWIARLKAANYHVGKTLTPWPYVVVTKASVVEQTRRVAKEFWGFTERDVLIVGIDQLRSEFGKRFVKEKITIIDGESSCKWIWNNNLYPIVIIWDEAHSLKNTGSTQSKIGQSYNEIPDDNTFQLFVSATPGTKVDEFKCFSVATRVPYSFGINRNAPLCNDHWEDFAKNIASNFGSSDVKPCDHSPAAIDRLMDYLKDYIIRVKGVRWQFHARNKIRIIDFETKEGKEYYDSAIERFEKEKAKYEASECMSASEIRFNILAQLTIFLKAAESNPDRIALMAREMYHDVMEGYAVFAAVRYKVTICKLVTMLMDKFGVRRDQISLIWGGAPKGSKKQKAKLAITGNADLMEALKGRGLTLEALDLDSVETNDIQDYDPKYKLGPQNQKQRQEEIDRYQRGESLYCFYTFRAGGVGLSLHHTDEQTKVKVRRKESGYAYEEDIPLIPTRPRKGKIAPTWSAIELVQGVGRAPRLTSLSDTDQELLFFKGTVEERQARVVGCKLQCLTKVVKNHETWEDLIIGRKGMSEDDIEKVLAQDQITKIEDSDDEDSDSDSGLSFEEEEE